MDKDAQKLWFDTPFVEIETEWLIMEYALIQPTEHSFFIELYVNEVFAQPYRLLLIWKMDEITCSKILLEKGKNVVAVQTAKMPLETGMKLLEMAQTLSIPILANEIGAGRDGSFFKLKTGQSTNTACFQWWDASLPPVWESLENLAVTIVHFEKIIDYQKASYKSYQLEYEGESSLLGESKSFFISFKSTESNKI